MGCCWACAGVKQNPVNAAAARNGTASLVVMAILSLMIDCRRMRSPLFVDRTTFLTSGPKGNQPPWSGGEALARRNAADYPSVGAARNSFTKV
jgi:hypothetical protein